MAQKILPQSAFNSAWEEFKEVIQNIRIAEDEVEVVVMIKAILFAEYF